jgi:hypothetical protein
MLMATLLSIVLAASPRLVDSGSTVTVQEKSAIMSYTDFKYATVGLVDRSALGDVSLAQDSLILSLRKQKSTCSSLVASKSESIRIRDSIINVSHAHTTAVRDSAKEESKKRESTSYWSGFKTGSLVTVGTELIVALVAIWGLSAVQH